LVPFQMSPGRMRPMGFDPNRPQVRRPTDYLFVAAAVVVCLALLAWAFLG